MKKQSGFTLLELLITIGIISILAGIVIIAVNPSKQFAAANNAQRKSDISTLSKAVNQYSVDSKGKLPEFVDEGLERIVSTSPNATEFCNALVPTYIAALPIDPTDSDATFTDCNSTFDTGYEVGTKNNRVIVNAPNMENENNTGLLGVFSFSCGDTVDYEGQTYDTVEIGTQCWFAENLNVGTMLASSLIEPINDSTIQKWCYGSSTTNCDNEGGLYSWNEMMGYTTTEGAQGICPSGWHVPTDAEQNTLDQYLATGTCNPNRNTWDCDPAGTSLKSGGSSNFNAILGGFRSTDGSFYNQGTYTYFWSSSGSVSAWMRDLHSFYSTVGHGATSKRSGFSVRCLQD